MQITLGKEAQAIVNLMSKAGTITIAQAAKLLEGTNAIPQNIAKLLSRHRYADLISDTYLIPFARKNVNMGAVACVWVIFDLLEYDDGTLSIDDVETIIRGNSFIDMTYIQDEKTVVNVVYADKNTINKVIASRQHMENYAAEEVNTKGFFHMYVTTDKAIVKKIKDMKLSYPYKIAYLEGDIDEGPEVTYL